MVPLLLVVTSCSAFGGQGVDFAAQARAWAREARQAADQAHYWEVERQSAQRLVEATRATERMQQNSEQLASQLRMQEHLTHDYQIQAQVQRDQALVREQQARMQEQLARNNRDMERSLFQTSHQNWPAMPTFPRR